MTDYPKYICDEAERRMSLERGLLRSFMPGRLTFNEDMASHRALANLLIESGFNPPVDPLLSYVFNAAWQSVYEKSGDQGSFEKFRHHLALAGLTVTVTKTGEA